MLYNMYINYIHNNINVVQIKLFKFSFQIKIKIKNYFIRVGFKSHSEWSFYK